MSLIDKGIIAAVLALICAAGLWWGWTGITDAIRAPAIARAELAEGANKTLAAEVAKVKAEADRLNTIIAARTEREAADDRKLRGLENALNKLAASKPAVRAWANEPVPVDVLGLRDIQDAGAGDKNSTGRVQNTDQPNRADQPTAAAGSRGDEQRHVQPVADAGGTSQPVQPTAGRRADVPRSTIAERIKRALGE